MGKKLEGRVKRKKGGNREGGRERLAKEEEQKEEEFQKHLEGNGSRGSGEEDEELERGGGDEKNLGG